MPKYAADRLSYIYWSPVIDRQITSLYTLTVILSNFFTLVFTQYKVHATLKIEA